MKHIVELSSEDYGSEYFHYDSRKEALAGLARLAKASSREHKRDKVVRRVSLVIGER
jgi:hypothetical protein